MRAAGLRSVHPRPYKRTTWPDRFDPRLADLLRRDFAPAGPDRAWVGDVTYIRNWTGWAFLATVIDCYSRKVVGFALADHMRTDLIVDALRMAIIHRDPPPGVIFHSDRGAQGEFNRSSQHLDRGGVRWAGTRSWSRCPSGRGGSGRRTGR